MSEKRIRLFGTYVSMASAQRNVMMAENRLQSISLRPCWASAFCSGRIVLVVTSIALASAAASAIAQTYPARAVRFIVPAPPGGGADILARTLGQRLGDLWGQQ